MRKTALMGGAAALLGPMSAAERKRGRYMRGPDGHEGKTAAELATETKAAFDKRFDEVKGLAEDALGKLKGGEVLPEGYKDKIDGALTVMNEAKGRLDELEQKAARRGGDPQAEKSIGQQYIDSPEFKAAFANGARQGQNVGIEVKTITSLSTDASGSAGAAVRPDRIQTPMAMLPDRRLTIRNLIAPGSPPPARSNTCRKRGLPTTPAWSRREP